MKKKFLIPFLVIPMLFSCGGNDFVDVPPKVDPSASEKVILNQRTANIRVGESVTLIAHSASGSSHSA